MNKTNLIGIILIGVVIIVYSVFLLPKQTPKSTLPTQGDTTQVVTDSSIPTDAEQETTTVITMGAQIDSLYAFSRLTSQPPEEYTLGNKQLRVTFSTQGAMPVSAELANYKSYKGTPVQLFAPGDFSINLPIRTNRNSLLNTKDLIWQASQPNDSTLLMLLPIDSTSYLRIAYTMPHEGYVLRMAIDGQRLGSLLRCTRSGNELADTSSGTVVEV